MNDELIQWLENNEFASVMPFDLGIYPYFIFDFTDHNSELQEIDMMDATAFEGYIFDKIKKHNAKYGIGLYLENRAIYRRSSVFTSREEERSVHLGIDIWIAEGTAVHAPLKGTIHSFNNNSSFGDYGPTLILEHHYPSGVFYTLYGHLSQDSMRAWEIGKTVEAGEIIAELGSYEENVGYPAHLHFQIIRDMGDFSGDYPGVCRLSEIKKWAENSPDPSLILKIPLSKAVN